MWAQIDGGELPAAGHRDDSLGRVVLARSLEAATVTAVAVSVERLTMRWFEFLIGVWPGRRANDDTEAPVVDAAKSIAKVQRPAACGARRPLGGLRSQAVKAVSLAASWRSAFVTLRSKDIAFHERSNTGHLAVGT